jgi:hypothetical protein
MMANSFYKIAGKITHLRFLSEVDLNTKLKNLKWGTLNRLVWFIQIL